MNQYLFYLEWRVKWNIINTYFVSQLVPALATEQSLRLASVPCWPTILLFFEVFFTFYLHEVLQTQLVFSLTKTWHQILLQGIMLLILESNIEKLGSECWVCSLLGSSVDSVSRLCEAIEIENVCTYINPCTHLLFIYLSIYLSIIHLSSIII